jgi:hypothetical protein
VNSESSNRATLNLRNQLRTKKEVPTQIKSRN